MISNDLKVTDQLRCVGLPAVLVRAVVGGRRAGAGLYLEVGARVGLVVLAGL